MLLSAYGNGKQHQVLLNENLCHDPEAARELFLTIPLKYQKDGLVREAMWRCFGKAAVEVFQQAERQGDSAWSMNRRG